MSNEQPNSASSREYRSTGRVILSWTVIFVFSFGQLFLIHLGWQATLTTFATSYPEHSGWLQSSFLRSLGVVFGLLCILYPIYFGLFRLGFRTRHHLDEQQRINSNRNA